MEHAWPSPSRIRHRASCVLCPRNLTLPSPFDAHPGRPRFPTADEPHETVVRLQAQLERVILGKGEVLRDLIVAILGGGHVLMEDRPGVGKTTLAKALARSLDTDFKRVQFTPDLLPTDILGASVYIP